MRRVQHRPVAGSLDNAPVFEVRLPDVCMSRCPSEEPPFPSSTVLYPTWTSLPSTALLLVHLSMMPVASGRTRKVEVCLFLKRVLAVAWE
jgi:hypothetical protein